MSFHPNNSHPRHPTTESTSIPRILRIPTVTRPNTIRRRPRTLPPSPTTTSATPPAPIYPTSTPTRRTGDTCPIRSITSTDPRIFTARRQYRLNRVNRWDNFTFSFRFQSWKSDFVSENTPKEVILFGDVNIIIIRSFVIVTC